MPRQRSTTPNKLLLQRLVEENPGLQQTDLAKIAEITPCRVGKILNELAAMGDIHYKLIEPGVLKGRKWYGKP